MVITGHLWLASGREVVAPSERDTQQQSGIALQRATVKR
jgi:hypothetical protein